MGIIIHYNTIKDKQVAMQRSYDYLQEATFTHFVASYTLSITLESCQPDDLSRSFSYETYLTT